MTTKYQFNDEALSKGPFTTGKNMNVTNRVNCWDVLDVEMRPVATCCTEADARFFIAMRNGGAKRIWQEMSTGGSSRTLECSYALCDLPIPLLYGQLDAAYPGSKFILTIRDENEWLESVRRHWDRNINPFRSAWDTDPFTHRVHNLLYRRKDFDAETFLNRYRRHNAEVREYFKDRPNDLLIMDVDAGAGFKELCDFFDCVDPGVPYPRIDPTTPEPIEDFIKQI